MSENPKIPPIAYREIEIFEEPVRLSVYVYVVEMAGIIRGSFILKAEKTCRITRYNEA